MKAASMLLFLCFSFIASFGQSKEVAVNRLDTTKKVQVVEASCGQCKLGLSGTDCNLAIRIDGKAYFVDGTHIDEHGDAHAKEGFCNAIRKAEVQGEVMNDRFVATYFKLVPLAKKKS